MIWLIFCILQIGFFFLILSLGYWIASKIFYYFKLPETFWIDRICLGVFVIVFLFSILGIVTLILPWNIRQIFSVLSLSLIFFLSLYLFIQKDIYKDIIVSSRIEKIFFSSVLLMSGLGLAISILPVRLPGQLIDGPYVAKHDYLGVRIQYITGNLPTDNSLPHVVTEYLLRDISFQKEHPIMPGQEVSNRPILVSLVLVPIRAAFDLPSRLVNGLPKFSYVGSLWPDFSVLMEDDCAYLFSLSIGIMLNAFILLAIAAFVIRMENKSNLIALATVALILSSPYFIFQTIFTWPKELASFFILYSILLYKKLKSPLLAGGFLAFAYLSHPYAIVFFIGVILYGFYTYPQLKSVKIQDKFFKTLFLKFKPLILFSLAFLLLILPWFIWSRFILYISSDLILQNFIQHGQQLKDFFWVRLVNFFNTTLPVYFLHYPFDLNNFVAASSTTIPGAVGIIIFMSAIMFLFEKKSWSFSSDKIFLIYIPSLLLIFIFSNQAVPALHGLQGPIALFLLIGIIQFQKMKNKFWLSMILGGQILSNVIILGFYFYKLL